MTTSIYQVQSSLTEGAAKAISSSEVTFLTIGRTTLAVQYCGGCSHKLNFSITSRTNLNTWSVPQNISARASSTWSIRRSGAISTRSIAGLADRNLLIQEVARSTLNTTDRITTSCVLKPSPFRTDSTVGWAVSAVSTVQIARFTVKLFSWKVAKWTGAYTWTLKQLKRWVARNTVWWLRTITSKTSTWASQTLSCCWVIVHISCCTSWQTVSVWV